MVSAEGVTSTGLSHTSFGKAAWRWKRRERLGSDEELNQSAYTSDLKAFPLRQPAFDPKYYEGKMLQILVYSYAYLCISNIFCLYLILSFWFINFKAKKFQIFH